MLREARLATVTHGHSILGKDGLLEHLAAFFTRMSVQVLWVRFFKSFELLNSKRSSANAAQMFAHEVPTLHSIADELRNESYMTRVVYTKSHFPSLRTARDTLANITLRLFYPSTHDAIGESRLDMLIGWWEAFAPFREAYESQRKSRSQPGGVALLLLQFHVLFMEVTSKYDDDATNGSWWRLQPEMQSNIFKHASAAISAARSTNLDIPGSDMFHVDIGIGPLILHLFLRCRNSPSIRQDCVTIINKACMQEGLSHGSMMKQVIEKLDEMGYDFRVDQVVPGDLEGQLNITFRGHRGETCETFKLYRQDPDRNMQLDVSQMSSP